MRIIRIRITVGASIALMLCSYSVITANANNDKGTPGRQPNSVLSYSRSIFAPDQIAATRSAYAKSHGIPVPELDKADKAGLQISQMQQALRSRSPNTFGGLWISASPNFGVSVAYKEGLPEIRAIVDSFSLPVRFEKRSISEKDMRSKLARPLPEGVEVVWSLQANSVEIRGSADQETVAAIHLDFDTDASVSEHPEKTIMRPVHQGGLGLKQAPNQVNNSCTTGFTIMQYGVRALTTAAHCNNTNILLDQEADGSFQNLSSPPNSVSCTATTDMETVWPADSQSVSSTVQGTPISGTMSPIIGATAWRYGSNTGWRFGTWLSLSTATYGENNCPSLTHSLYVLDVGSDPGDSGGPIISQGSGGSVWRGIATNATGDAARTGAQELSTQLSALGIGLAP